MSYIDDDLYEEYEQDEDELAELSDNQLLAAETFGYSYAHYAEKVEYNTRYSKIMPNDMKTLSKAEKQGWSVKQLAKKFDISEEDAEGFMESYQQAKAIIFAGDAQQSFREAVRQSIENALEDGLSLDDTRAIDKLVKQVCYRTADFGYLLSMEGRELQHYSEDLRNDDGDYDAGELD